MGHRLLLRGQVVLHVLFVNRSLRSCGLLVGLVDAAFSVSVRNITKAAAMNKDSPTAKR